jgi:hypothetical protein
MIRDERGELCNPTWPIRDWHRDAHQPTIRRQASLNHSTQRGDVNVAATQWHHHTPPLEIFPIQRTPRKQRREPGRASALDDHLLRLDETKHSECDVTFLDHHHLIHPVPCHREGVRTHLQRV